MGEIKNVHDKFFKKVFSKKENIKDFLKVTFPQIEHKSYKDKKVILQLLSYMLKMWKRDMGDKRPLRIIIPLVFYHGRKKWDIPVKFRENINLLTGIVLMKNVYYNNYSNLRYIFNLWAKTGLIGEKEYIRSVTDRKKLDHVIEEILSSESKEELLGYLK